MDKTDGGGYLERGDGSGINAHVSTTEGFGNGQKVNYGKYENPKLFGSYQVFLLTLDFLFNLAVDCVYGEPLVILVCFVLQSLALIINVILYIMSSANQAMQTGLKQRTVRHHEANIVTCITYMILTAWWYIWALRRSWPSVSDQFSFSFSAPDTNTLSESVAVAIMPGSNSPHTQHHNKTVAKGGADGQSTKEKPFINTETFTLWSPGFLALYTIQRTVAVIHYIVYLKATFVVLNTSTLDKLYDYDKSSRETITSHVNPTFVNDHNDRHHAVALRYCEEDMNSSSNSQSEDMEDAQDKGTRKPTDLPNPSIAQRTNPPATKNSAYYSSNKRRKTLPLQRDSNSPRLLRGVDADSPSTVATSTHRTHQNGLPSNKNKRLTTSNLSRSEDLYDEVSEDMMDRRY